MKAQFKILVDGSDITSLVKDRLLNLTVEDRQGVESDSFSLSLDNRDGKISFPKSKVEIEVFVGIESLNFLGRYIVDNIEESYPPRTLSISGASANLTGSLKSHKQRNWDDTTLEVVLWDLAIEHGLELALHDHFLGIDIKHLDQTAESDLALVKRLASDYDALFKIADSRLIFTLADASQRLSGQPIKAINILKTQLINWRYAQTERHQITQCKAKWRNIDTSNESWEVAGTEGVTHILSKLYRSHADAIKGVSETLRKLQTPQESLSLQLSALANQPAIKAESAITLTSLSPSIDGNWVVDSASHQINNNGYQVTISAKRLY